MGVDVFFVLSGYLITRLLLEEHFESSKSSLPSSSLNAKMVAFYARRIRRLLPALWFVLLVTLALYLLFVPGFGNTKKFAVSIKWSAFGFANLFFKKNTGGYFDDATSEMPLLHLWSLGVEEQFYLLWPLCVSLLLSHTSKSFFKATLWGVSLLSLFASQYLILNNKSPAAFYLMPYRAWELGLGALLASFAPVRHYIASALGVLLLFYSVFCFDHHTAFPGFFALIPTLGTALLIWGTEAPSNPLKKILSSKILVEIGKLSYGWYLWHWPLLALLKVWNLGVTPPMGYQLLALLMAFVMAWVSLKFIENPIRFRSGRWKKLREKDWLLFGLFTSSIVILLSLATQSLEHKILDFKLGPALYSKISKKSSLADRCDALDKVGRSECTITGDGTPHSAPLIAIWGDSHGCSYFPMIESFAQKNKIQATQYCQGQSPPLLSNPAAPFEAAIYQDLKNKITLNPGMPVSVVLVARWVAYTTAHTIPFEKSTIPVLAPGARALEILREQLRANLAGLSALGIHRILVLLPYPEFEHSILRCLQKKSQSECAIERARFEGYRKPVVEVITSLAQDFNNVQLIDPTPVVCTQDHCPQVLGDLPVVIDNNHPTVDAALEVGKHYEAQLDWLIHKR